MPMSKFALILGLSFLLCATASARDEGAQSLALQKFQNDVKAAATNGSISADRATQVQQSAASLQSYNRSRKPGAPVDLLTPYQAVAVLKSVAADPNLTPADKETLRQDLIVVINSQVPSAPATEPAKPGSNLESDVLKAVLNGNPTEAQVKQLQDCLNQLRLGEGVNEAKIGLRAALKKAQLDIMEIITTDSFRDSDRQAVLGDLSALGPRGAKLAH
jgi:hypothetical protein